MPIDFPTVKNADPAVFPISTPAATDTVLGRTNAGADRNFYLGNIAGMAPVAVANDQALAYIGGNWTAYALTSQARTLLAATTQAAQRTAIGAADSTNVMDLTSNQTAGGNKVFSGIVMGTGNSFGAQFETTIGDIRMVRNGGMPGAILRNGDYTGSAYASGGFRQSPTEFQIGVSTSAGVTTLSRWVSVAAAAFFPGQHNTLACGLAANAWTEVRAQNTTISTSDARLKTEPRQLRGAEFKAFSAVCRLPPVWRWLSRVHGDENCEPEGRSARKHFGPTVQAAMQVFADNGLDAFENAPFCYDEWEAQEEQWHEWPAKDAVLDDDGNVLEPAVEAGRELIQPAREAGDRYSFRKEELLCGMVSALARENDEQAAKIEAQQSLLDDLLARVAALEAKG